MTTYRLVPESEWKRALDALESLQSITSALREAGRAEMSFGQQNTKAVRRRSKTAAPRRPAQPRRTDDRLDRARQVIERVKSGSGSKHRPKQFDKQGPKITDFVYVLMPNRFNPPQAIDAIGKFVELNPVRREAGSQVRNALRLDKRFRKHDDGSYSKAS